MSYAAEIAATLGTDAVAFTTGSINGDGGLGNAGASKVLHAANANTSDSQQMTRLIVAAASQVGASVIIFA